MVYFYYFRLSVCVCLWAGMCKTVSVAHKGIESLGACITHGCEQLGVVVVVVLQRTKNIIRNCLIFPYYLPVLKISNLLRNNILKVHKKVKLQQKTPLVPWCVIGQCMWCRVSWELWGGDSRSLLSCPPQRDLIGKFKSCVFMRRSQFHFVLFCFVLCFILPHYKIICLC